MMGGSLNDREFGDTNHNMERLWGKLEDEVQRDRAAYLREMVPRAEEQERYYNGLVPG